jgi:hypothetical protein
MITPFLRVERDAYYEMVKHIAFTEKVLYSLVPRLFLLAHSSRGKRKRTVLYTFSSKKRWYTFI